MTSGNLFFKLVRQDCRRRMWCPVLIFIAYFLGMEVHLLMELGKYLKEEQFQRAALYVTDYFFGCEASLISIVTCGAAFLCGISGYAYLHAKTQLDMYHSLPASRTQLFWAKYVSGILQFFIPFVVHTLICAGIAASRDIFTTKAAFAMLFYIALQLVVFVLAYGVTVLAVMLTGNIIISILGTGVLFSYSAILSVLYWLLAERFFQTCVIYENRVDAWFSDSERIWCFSPLSMLIRLFITPYNTTMEAAQKFYKYDAGYVWILAAAAIVYSLAAYFIYLKRASEAAGSAIAFRVAEPVIKTMIVIPAAFFAALFFAELSADTASDGWFLFGLIFSFVIFSVAMEIIFRLNLRSAFMHKKQFLFNAACTALLFVVLRYDVIGFDTYVPSDAQLQSCAISVHALMPLSQNIQVSPYGVHFLNPDEYRMANMAVQGNQSVMELARKAAKEQIAYQYFDYYEGIEEDPVYIATLDRQAHYQAISFGYHLLTGETVYRKYYIDMADADTVRLLSDIFADPMYKIGCTPLFNENWDIAFDAVRCENNYRVKELRLTPDMQSNLIQTYQREYLDLSLDTVMHVIPVGTLDFMIKNGHNRTSYSGEMLVYPQFEQTIALLRTYGFDMNEKLTADDVKEIRVQKTSEEEAVEYTDKEEIQQILDNIVNDGYSWQIGSFTDYSDKDYIVKVIYHTQDSVSSYYCFVKGQVPDFVKISKKNN